jgi:hypothetical protein
MISTRQFEIETYPATGAAGVKIAVLRKGLTSFGIYLGRCSPADVISPQYAIYV